MNWISVHLRVPMSRYFSVIFPRHHPRRLALGYGITIGWVFIGIITFPKAKP